MPSVLDPKFYLDTLKKLSKIVDEIKCFVEDCCRKIPINIGNGIGLYRRLHNNNWEFKSLKAGNNVTITEDLTEVTISATGGGGFVCSDLNSCSTDNLPEGSTNLYYTNARVLYYGDTQWVQLDGSYSNPSWLTSLAYSKISGVPANYITSILDTSTIDLDVTTGVLSANFINAAGYITSSALTPYLTITSAAATYQPIGTYATASNVMTFTNKSGNISQWTNNNNYIDLTALSSVYPLSYDNSTGVISTGMNSNKLIGRATPGVGVFEEIVIGTGLSFSGTTLNSTIGTVTSVGLTAGVGINLTGANPITSSGVILIDNTAPDQTVVLTNGTGISVTGTYPNFTITNTAPSTTSGTVTSVALSTPSGLQISGSPITTSGTLAISLTPNYFIPTRTEETNWNLAHSERIDSLTTTGSGAATLTSNVLNIPNYSLISPSGVVASVSGTANRITSSGSVNPILDIAGNYQGQNSITTLGTISTGIWKGTTIDDAYISSASVWNNKTTLATVNAQNLSVFASTTSSQLAGVISDETGSGSLMFNTSPTVATSLTASYATASTVAIFDSSKNIISAALATYPSLTELSYLKGATSAIQTQISAKQNTITTGTTAQYIKGDLSLGTTPTTSYSILQGVIGAVVGASVTRYNSFDAQIMSTTELPRQVAIPMACTLSNFYVLMTTAQPASGSLVLTIRKNGADTALVVTVPLSTAAGASVADTTHSVSFAQGDLLAISMVNNATGNSGTMSVSCTVATIIT